MILPVMVGRRRIRHQGRRVPSWLETEFRAQAADQFGSKFGDVHAFGDDKFAAQYGTRLVLVRELAAHAAVLTLLVPAEAAIGNRFRADELKSAQQRIPLRYE